MISIHIIAKILHVLLPFQYCSFWDVLVSCLAAGPQFIFTTHPWRFTIRCQGWLQGYNFILSRVSGALVCVAVFSHFLLCILSQKLTRSVNIKGNNSHIFSAPLHAERLPYRTDVINYSRHSSGDCDSCPIPLCRNWNHSWLPIVTKQDNIIRFRSSNSNSNSTTMITSPQK